MVRHAGPTGARAVVITRFGFGVGTGTVQRIKAEMAA
jgi:hypothetical protein